MRIEKTQIENYQSFPKEKHRPPSKGGNTRAWYQHVLTIGGEKYSFLALGSKKWVFKGDLVSFDWDWNETRKYRNIHEDTVQTWDSNGKEVVRGERGTKPWRSADTRLPVSSREAAD